jgi:hypothetical protein
MLTALEQALTQKQQRNKESQIMQDFAKTNSIASFQSVFHSNSQHDPAPDEESTEADEHGAVASLLSGPSEGESIDAVSPETHTVTPAALSHTSHDDTEQTSDHEKSTKVCRHWKSKGWCRMQSDGHCKFMHPVHKRGVTAPPACIGGGLALPQAFHGSIDDGISRGVRPGMSTILNLSDTIKMQFTAGAQVPLKTDTININAQAPSTKRKKKRSKDRPSRGGSAQAGNPQQEVGD